MNDLVVILSQIQWPTLIAIGAMLYIFYSRLDGKIEKLSEKVEDIDRCLCRIEGAMSVKDCCILKAESQHKAQ